MEEATSWLAQAAFLTCPVLAEGWHRPQWVEPSPSIINPKNVPEDTSRGHADGDHSSSEVPSFWVTLICVKLTKTK